MKITLPISQIHNLPNHEFIGFAKEFLSGVSPEKSGYYKWLLQKKKPLWNNIVTKEQCLERAKLYRDICLSIKNDGYKEANKISFNAKDKTIAYGPITARKFKDKYILSDGQHRACCLIALGETELTVDEAVYSYQDQFPVHRKLKHLAFDWNYKSVIELGCNIGGLAEYVTLRGASHYEGYDHKQEYIDEAKSRYPSYEYHVMKAQDVTGECDVLCCLGVFHHMQEESIRKVIENIKSKWLVFEVPIGDEPFKNYLIRNMKWYQKLFNPVSLRVYDYGFKYPIERKIFVYERHRDS